MLYREQNNNEALRKFDITLANVNERKNYTLRKEVYNIWLEKLL